MKKDNRSMANLKPLLWFSITCLALAAVAFTLDLALGRTGSNPMAFICLFVGLLGSFTTRVLTVQEKRLEALETKANDRGGHDNA